MGIGQDYCERTLLNGYAVCFLDVGFVIFSHMLALNETILMFRSWHTRKKYEALHADLQKQMLDFILGERY